MKAEPALVEVGIDYESASDNSSTRTRFPPSGASSSANSRSVEDVLAAWLDSVTTERPVEGLSDDEVLALAELRLTDEQDASLNLPESCPDAVRDRLPAAGRDP